MHIERSGNDIVAVLEAFVPLAGGFGGVNSIVACHANKCRRSNRGYKRQT